MIDFIKTYSAGFYLFHWAFGGKKSQDQLVNINKQIGRKLVHQQKTERKPLPKLAVDFIFHHWAFNGKSGPASTTSTKKTSSSHG